MLSPLPSGLVGTDIQKKTHTILGRKLLWDKWKMIACQRGTVSDVVPLGAYQALSNQALQGP